MTRDLSGKTIALADPLWVGHHPMYFSEFVAAFLRLGAFVIGLCPDPSEAMRTSLEKNLFPGIHKRCSMHHLPTGTRSWFGGRFEGDPLRTFQRWQRVASALRQAEQKSGHRADLVFFPYLDSYLRFLPFPSVPRITLNRPWSGLYLRNHHHGSPASTKSYLRRLAKGDALIRSRLCRGIGVLDERFIGPMERYTGRAVRGFPDITDAALPDRASPLAEAIRDKAAGRKIIGLIGLERRKGLLNLFRVAKLAREAQLPWYFACAGRFDPAEYSTKERAELDRIARHAASGEIDNVHFDPSAGRIPAEADFNSVFRTFDVAWAAYEGFEGSSGTLGKAAAFDIPCLASRGECIGQRIESYRTGLTIPQGNSSEALEAIQRILAHRDWNDRPLIGDYERFRRDHGQARLDAVLLELLGRV